MTDEKELYDTWFELLGEYRIRFGHAPMSPNGGGVADMGYAEGIERLRDALERNEPFKELVIDDLPPDVLL
uniref:Uncharacterized protein n=1 Tax=Dulem virus 32 TaxID=3145750 RepID=A0AAU8B270_9CAUD